MKTFLKIAAFFIAAVAMFFIGFFANDAMARVPPDSDALTSLLNPAEEAQTPTETFQAHYNLIQSNFYRPVEEDKLRNAAMSGLVASIGDPHTNYLEPSIAERFSTDTKGEFVGVGARLQDDPLGTKVFSVFPNGPAKEAGLKGGDVITGVDKTSVAGMSTDDIVEMIRGEEGTIVTLTIVREDQPKSFDLKIKRRNVEIPTVEHRIIADNIGYLQVTNFSSVTPTRFEQAIREMNGDGIKGLVIDLRSNPGGLLQAAVDMLSLFVENKAVVSMRTRNGKVQTVSTRRGQVIADKYPVVVLINEESASASEIFAGVLRDYKKATMVGEHTYGKASVQDLFSLPEGASAKVTIAKYFLPSGEDISRKMDEDGSYLSGGIKPDVEVDFEFKEDAQFGVQNKDSQLDKAIQLIKSKQK